MSGSFTSIDDLVNALSTNFTGQSIYLSKMPVDGNGITSTFPAGGSVAAGTYGSSGTANGRVTTVATTGAVKYINATGPAVNYLTSFEVWSEIFNSGRNNIVLLVDRISDILLTGSNTGTLTGVDATSRLSATGGAQIFIEGVSSGTGSAMTITYTNQAGTGSRVTPSFTRTGTIVNGQTQVSGVSWIQLQDGDSGVRSIQSISSTGSGGTYAICLMRPLAMVVFPNENDITGGNIIYAGRNTVQDVHQFPKIYDSSCLHTLFYVSRTAQAYSNPFSSMIRIAAN